MIDEKRLAEFCISNDTASPEIWKIEASEDDLDELMRLARLGLWAEKSAVPTLRGLVDIVVSIETQAGFPGKPKSSFSTQIQPAQKALAALPKSN